MKLYEIKVKNNGTHFIYAKNNLEMLKLANQLKNLEIERVVDENGKTIIHNNFNN